ncbi:thiol:disulfide interchange protein [Canicola haemoglobinophilus]|uniref:Thiol:disulfide interchange protein n=1 Tax=Canicola haemoglobinophilus TaxID=733 RepID=A0A1V4B1E3_9PAST|nr:DsbA family protein [Canicola haemoglobinophilus]OOS00942.1 thiol:disulfide interchange protein [Canicola haemoglobinophilus]STO55120.1 protein disulfide-isomerase [Canicola haemoglobinophilus]STO59273.1 protein disulfide-isomerase [Canicola haemoglobinophilus]STO69309.1 protein disulfide-isomerase [Canicola haemoglobinophilus]
MKKILLAFASFFFLSSAQALELQEGKQYIELNQPHSVQTEIIEFFSFSCPHCFNFETKYQIPQKIKADLPKDATFKQYHVDWLGEEMVRAWSLAMILGIEEKVKMPLFEMIIEKRKAPTLDNIRDVFLANGVTAEQFDGGINSFAVTALTNKQITLAKKLGVRATPEFYVNGKYKVNGEGLSRSMDGFIKDYVETVKGLLQK